MNVPNFLICTHDIYICTGVDSRYPQQAKPYKGKYKMCKIFRGPDQTKQAQSAKTTKMWNTFVLGQSAP